MWLCANLLRILKWFWSVAPICDQVGGSNHFHISWKQRNKYSTTPFIQVHISPIYFHSTFFSRFQTKICYIIFMCYVSSCPTLSFSQVSNCPVSNWPESNLIVLHSHDYVLCTRSSFMSKWLEFRATVPHKYESILRRRMASCLPFFWSWTAFTP